MRLFLIIVVTVVGAAAAAGCGGGTAAMIEDPEGYSCKADDAREGRCPENEYFGKSRQEVANEKAMAAMSVQQKKAQEQEATQRTRRGTTTPQLGRSEHSDEWWVCNNAFSYDTPCGS